MKTLIFNLGTQLKWGFGQTMPRPVSSSSRGEVQASLILFMGLITALLIPGGLLLGLSGWLYRRAFHQSAQPCTGREMRSDRA